MEKPIYKSGDIVDYRGEWRIVCTTLKISDVYVTYITGRSNMDYMHAVGAFEIKPVTYQR